MTVLIKLPKNVFSKYVELSEGRDKTEGCSQLAQWLRALWAGFPQALLLPIFTAQMCQSLVWSLLRVHQPGEPPWKFAQCLPVLNLKQIVLLPNLEMRLFWN